MLGFLPIALWPVMFGGRRDLVAALTLFVIFGVFGLGTAILGSVAAIGCVVVLTARATRKRPQVSFAPAILARIQFAFTISFHIRFPTMSIGLAMLLAVIEGL